MTNKPEREAAEKKCDIRRRKTEITKKLMSRKEGQKEVFVDEGTCTQNRWKTTEQKLGESFKFTDFSFEEEGDTFCLSSSGKCVSVVIVRVTGTLQNWND